MKQVVIEVLPDGSIKLEAQNFRAECEKATKALEEALGTAGNRKKKPEWYKESLNTQRT